MDRGSLPPKFVLLTVLWGPLIGFGYVSVAYLLFQPLTGSFLLGASLVALPFAVPTIYLFGSPSALAYAGLIALLGRAGRATTFNAVCCSVLLSTGVFLFLFALSDGGWSTVPRWDDVSLPLLIGAPTYLASLTCWILFAVLPRRTRARSAPAQ